MNVLVRILKTLFGTTTEQTSTAFDIDKIISATTEVTGVTRIQIMSTRREREYVIARWMAMYVARETTTMSFPQIGRAMNRDHTSVIYGIKNISKRNVLNTKINRDIAKIKQLVA